MKSQNIQIQSQKLTPQQVQLVRLLELSADELESRIHDELENNFVLEEGSSESEDLSKEEVFSEELESENMEGDSQQNTEVNVPLPGIESDDMPSFFDDGGDVYQEDKSFDWNGVRGMEIYEEGVSFRDDLKQQLRLHNLSERQVLLGIYLIDSLDDGGYLLRSLSDMKEDLDYIGNLQVELSELEEALTIVQGLEPPGIGARDLQECLILQLRNQKHLPYYELAFRILSKYFEDFTNHRYERLMRNLSISSHDLEAALRLVVSLHPKPAGISGFSDDLSTRVNHVTPDFIVENENGRLTLHLNESHVPSVRISDDCDKMLDSLQTTKGRKKMSAEKERLVHENKEAARLIKEKKISAQLFIDALQQRRQTLMAVMEVILVMQREYFLSGDIELLRPMVLSNVAERSGYDVSTVSRVTNGRYVQTDFGVVSVKQLFSGAAVLSEGNSTVTVTAVKEFLARAIEKENKRSPLNDDRLTDLLREAGFAVARRTVAKYREQLGYPTARLRRKV